MKETLLTLSRRIKDRIEELIYNAWASVIVAFVVYFILTCK